MGFYAFQEMNELTPISTSLEKFSHNNFYSVAANVSLMPYLKIWVRVQWRSFGFTRQLSWLWYIVFSWIKQIIRVWHSEPKMEFLSLSVDLPLCSRRGSCIRTLLRKWHLMWWSARSLFPPYSAESFMLRLCLYDKISLSGMMTSNNSCI